MKTARYLGSIAAATATLLVLAAGAEAAPAKKWLIDLNHSAATGGTVVLRVAPVGGKAIDVATKIPDGTFENRSAELIRAELRVYLGDGYKVDTRSGENVVVEQKGDSPGFELSVVSNSVNGLAIELKPE
jgi:hypothetical protein